MASEIRISADVQPGDIVFECPNCGKSLAIDARGAGMLVTCTDCHAEIQVPSELTDVIVEADETDEQPATNGVAERLEVLHKALERIEKNRQLDVKRFEAIRAEMTLIQASLDRIVAVLQDATAPTEPGDRVV